MGTLNETTGEAVAQVDRLAAALDEIQFGPLVDPVIGGINTVRDVLAAIDPSLLPDSVKDELAAAIDAFKAQFDGDPAAWFDREVLDRLNSAFDAAISAVRDTVAKLQRKLQQFAQEIGKLNPVELLKPVTNAFAELDATFAGLNPDALLEEPRKLLEKAVQTLQEHPPVALLAPVEQAFEQDVLEPANRIKPSELLRPAIDAFVPVQEAIQKLDFSDLAAGLPAPTLPDLAALVGAWDDALAAALAALDPGQLLEPVRAALAPVADTVAAAADDALMATGAQLKRLASLGDLFDTDVLTAAITGPLDRAATAIEQGPSQVAAVVRPVYQRLQTALARVNRAALPGPLAQEYDAVAAAIQALNPDTALAETGATLAAVARACAPGRRPLGRSDRLARRVRRGGGPDRRSTPGLPGRSS